MSEAFCYSESICQLYEFPAWHFALHLAFGEAEDSSGYKVLVVLQSEGESREL